MNIYFSLSELKGVCILYFVNIYFTLSELKGGRATSVREVLKVRKNINNKVVKKSCSPLNKFQFFYFGSLKIQFKSKTIGERMHKVNEVVEDLVSKSQERPSTTTKKTRDLCTNQIRAFQCLRAC